MCSPRTNLRLLENTSSVRFTASRPLNNLQNTEDLTDTSISSAICLTEGRGGAAAAPSCMKKGALFISEGRQREGGERLHRLNLSLMKDTVSPQDEQESVRMVKTSKASSGNVP